MPELPDLIDPNYITRINPPSAGAAEVARVINKIIQYLKDIDPALATLKTISKPMDEVVERKLGPHPKYDPELKQR